MNKKYLIIGGIFGLLLLLGVVSFIMFQPKAKPKPQQITLTWWKTFEDSENIQDFINDYQKANPNVRINFVKKDSTTYEQDLVNAIASGQGPDIFSIHNDWLPKHIDKLAPAPDTLMTLRSYQDAFVDVASTDFVSGEKIYAVPLATDVLALYYNKDLLGSAGISQPPATWPELVSDVQKITKVSKTGTFSRSGVALGTSANVNRAADILTLMMLQNGTKFYSSDFTSAIFDQTLTSPDGQQNYNPGQLALQMYTQFADPSKTSYTWNTKSDQSIDAFAAGEVAMMFSYDYMLPVIKTRAPNLNWGVSSVPQISEDVTKVNFANYWGEAVSKSSPNTAAAWDFLNFISGKAELGKYYAKHKLIASRKDMLPDQINDQEIGAFAESALTARSVYKKDVNTYEGVFLKMIDDVILNNIDPQDALSNGVQQIDLNLQKQ